MVQGPCLDGHHLGPRYKEHAYAAIIWVLGTYKDLTYYYGHHVGPGYKEHTTCIMAIIWVLHVGTCTRTILTCIIWVLGTRTILIIAIFGS